MSNKATTSAYLGGLEWCLSGYSNERRSRVLSCSAGDVAASLLFEPEDYDPYLSLTGEDDKVILKIERDLVQSGSTDGEDGGVLTIRLVADRHEDVYETSVADVVAVLRQESDKVAVDRIQSLVDHWLIILAERLIEVMMCTDTSSCQNTTIDFNIGDEITENLNESALGLVHEIEPGHVGATAALIGNMVYRLPACKRIDELLETVRPVGLDSLRMKGSLASPVKEEKFFYNTSNIVTSSVASCQQTEVSQRASFNLKSNGIVHFYAERPPRRLPLWELRVSQATASSRFTDDPGAISASIRTGDRVYYYEDEMRFESMLMSVFDEISPDIVEDVGSVVRTGNYLRSSEILMCSVSEVLVRYATGKNGVFSSKKDSDRAALSKESHSSVIQDNLNTTRVMTRRIIADQGSSLYNVEDMMLGVLYNVSSVCSWVDNIVARNTNKDPRSSSVPPAVVTMSSSEALNRCVCRMKATNLEESDDAYEFTMNLILCLICYLNELVLLSCEDMEARFYDTSDYDKMKQGRLQMVKTAIDLLKALEFADNRTCQNQR